MNEREGGSRKKRFGWRGALLLLGGIGAGATIMYLLDPAQGRRRRTVLRDALSAPTVREINSRSVSAGVGASGLAGDENFPDEREAVERFRGGTLSF